MTRNFILTLGALFLIGAASLFFILNKNSNTVDLLKKDTNYYNKIESLEMEDLVVGTGEEVVAGVNVKVNYKGTLTDGTEFDSSYTAGRQPFLVENIGTAQVIEGWNVGLIGMKVGGKRKLFIPSSLGYGSRAVGNIPANSTLIFEIELLEIVNQTTTDNSTSSTESVSNTTTSEISESASSSESL